MKVTTQGLIIREQVVGGSDRLVTVLTRDEDVYKRQKQPHGDLLLSRRPRLTSSAHLFFPTALPGSPSLQGQARQARAILP